MSRMNFRRRYESRTSYFFRRLFTEYGDMIGVLIFAFVVARLIVGQV